MGSAEDDRTIIVMGRTTTWRKVVRCASLYLPFGPCKAATSCSSFSSPQEPSRICRSPSNGSIRDKPYDDPDQGYQRAAEKNRARRFARYLEKADAMSPTALMPQRPKFHHQLRLEEPANWFSTPPRGRSSITTGSTASSATDSGWATIRPLGGFHIPIVMTRGVDKLTEMLQFQTINSTAKGVATALVNAILAKHQETAGDDVLTGHGAKPQRCRIQGHGGSQ